MARAGIWLNLIGIVLIRRSCTPSCCRCWSVMNLRSGGSVRTQSSRRRRARRAGHDLERERTLVLPARSNRQRQSRRSRIPAPSSGRSRPALPPPASKALQTAGRDPLGERLARQHDGSICPSRPVCGAPVSGSRSPPEKCRIDPLIIGLPDKSIPVDTVTDLQAPRAEKSFISGYRRPHRCPMPARATTLVRSRRTADS